MNALVMALAAALVAVSPTAESQPATPIDTVGTHACANVQTALVLPQLLGPLFGLPIPPEAFGPLQPVSAACAEFPAPTGDRECDVDARVKDALDNTVAPLAGIGAPLYFAPELLIADFVAAIESQAGTDGTAGSYVDTTLGCRSTTRPDFVPVGPPALFANAASSQSGDDAPLPGPTALIGPSLRDFAPDPVETGAVTAPFAAIRQRHGTNASTASPPQWPGQLVISLVIAALTYGISQRNRVGEPSPLGIGRFRNDRRGQPPSLR